MTKAIIFDCFGVLVTDGWHPFKQQHFGDNPERYQRATELNHMADAGLISFEDLTRELAVMAGLNPEDVSVVLRGYGTDNRLLGLVAGLKSNYKIGMLSNVSSNWLDTMFEPANLKLFDAIALSYEMGVPKPEPRAYEIVADKLYTAPEHCLFIDDQPAYVAAAQEQGMQGITYQGYEALVNSLQEKGIKISD